MSEDLDSKRKICIFGGVADVIGVVLLGLSFAINAGPPPNATSAELMKFGHDNYAAGPVLIVLFVFSLFHVAGATQGLSGWMTFFGAAILMTVSLVEIPFYKSALHADPAMMPYISLVLISAVQHLYFIVAASSPFLPLGIVLLRSALLPQLLGYLALALAAAAVFVTLGAVYMLRLALPGFVIAFGGVQALWWLTAAITLIVRSRQVQPSQT